jgi:hypothetical protein
MRKIIASLFAGLFLIVGLSACSGQDDADVVSANISKDADNFKVLRRIVFYNGITDNYMLEIVGYCNIDVDEKESQLEVTCKLGNDAYKKHFLGIADNATYFVEQLESSDVSEDFYTVTYKPTSILPNVQIR